MYDVIIIGAGISGLVCGCYLAKAGMKVLIVEQHNKPGGYCTSFKRNGFLFDAAAHSFGSYREGGHVNLVFRDLGVDKIVRIKRFDPSDRLIAPDFGVSISNDFTATIKDLVKIFPREESSLVDFYDFLVNPDQSEFSKLKDKTFSSLLRSFFKDEKLISSLAFFILGNGGLSPSLMHAFSGAKIFREFIIDGGYYPEGGMQTLPDAFDYIVRQNGGNILYGRPVKKIILKNNRAAGVQLDTNETVESKYVVSACDMIQTFRTFLKKEVVGEELSDAINKLVPSLSNFILYIGIDKPFQGLPQAGTNTWFLPHYNLDDIYRQVLKGNLAEAGIFMLRVSPDEKTIVAFMAAPFETKEYWHQNKRRVAQFFLERICKQIPDLSQHIACSDAATPSTLFDYTGNYQGAAYGWAKTPSQTFEPVFSRTTGIERLYLTGHWTSLAFGLPGTCYSGQDTAKRILRKAKIMG